MSELLYGRTFLRYMYICHEVPLSDFEKSYYFVWVREWETFFFICPSVFQLYFCVQKNKMRRKSVI